MIDVKEQIDSAAKRYATTRDPKAREEVANLIQPLLASFAQGFVRGKPLEADVVLSSANLGLLDALEKYQPDRGARFITYARPRIDGAMLDGVRCNETNTRLSLRREKRDNAARDAFYKEHGRKPTPEELETIVDSSEELTQPIIRERSIPTDAWRAEFAIDLDPTSKAATNDAFEYLTRGLSRQERMAFTLYYRDGMRMTDIADTVGLSESRISQILTSIKARMAPNAKELAVSVGIG